ncbi:MAG: DnaA/Hda family protein [Alphaproteobacteria bacterium]|nr:DnaA/Hda family protein [Alphaproteobacteria bacterium]
MDQKSPKQYTLPLIQEPDFTSYSYFVSQSNKAAYQLVELWPEWPFRRHVIFGPTGHGKTHLGHILRDLTQGIFINAIDINADVLEAIKPKETYIVDDIHRIQQPVLLFHFYNLTLENDCSVVYLSSRAPGQHDMGLPDLNSRLRSLAVIELPQPDDDLCRAIIRKVFLDLQIIIADEVVEYMLAHMSRSLTDIHYNIQLLNQRSMEMKRNITIPFLKSLQGVR